MATRENKLEKRDDQCSGLRWCLRGLWLLLEIALYSQELTELIKMRAVKQHFQNFLLGLRLTDKIVRKIGSLPNAYVYAPGHKPGRIASLFFANVGRLPVVESILYSFLDYRCFHMPPQELRTVYGNAVTFKIEKTFPKSFRQWVDDLLNACCWKSASKWIESTEDQVA